MSITGYFSRRLSVAVKHREVINIQDIDFLGNRAKHISAAQHIQCIPETIVLKSSKKAIWTLSFISYDTTILISDSAILYSLQ